MSEQLEAAQRTQLAELNARARTYTLQLWTVPLTYFGITVALLGGGDATFSATARELVGAVLGLFVIGHLVGVEDGRRRAVMALREIETDLGLRVTAENKPVFMWPLLLATVFFSGCLFGLVVSRL